MAHTDEIPDAMQCLLRARSLMDRSRYPDAAEWLQKGIQADASSATMFTLLAICWMNIDGKERHSVDAARHAVSLEPEDGTAHSVLALTLGNTAKDGQTAVYREALAAAEEAVKLDPDDDFAHTTRARMCLHLQRYPAAEAAARKALELDPEATAAAEVLSACLLHQGKQEDHDALVAYQLQHHAEDDSAHASAGWNALRKGDHRRANTHFLEALRLNPMHEGARLGLVEGYRARSFFYRGLLKFDGWMNQLTAGRQTAFWIGGYVAYRVLYKSLKTSAPWAAAILAACWLLLVFWSSLARGLSSFLMLLDRSARRSLRTLEKWEGVVVGGMTMLALMFLVASCVSSPGLRVMALGLFLGALPAASAFTNDHYIGKWIYWAVAAFCIGCAFYPVVLILVALAGGPRLPMASAVLMWGIVTAVVFSFVRMFNIGYR